ncbi:MAG: PD-(D/E)XK nuclease family protein [Pirellulaceae bacterium]|jgi:hypothetical protein|nr:PD-(D/E)XK nuclease family protein [Pirellulaceae bacterium]MDP7019358.1 PD-(D/E)XK nuclease family protein [Pirellulaceae bacterium]
MPVTRKFLDWTRPALDVAVDNLLERYVQGGRADLERVVVAFPGSRAGRRFLELLVERCERREIVLLPPRIITLGQLPELLYESKLPFASDLVQQLAWVHALRAEGRRKLARMIPALPDEDDVPRWIGLGKLFWRQHRELAAEAKDFSHVVDIGWRRGEMRERNRWRLLRKVQENYLRILDRLELWDVQTARLFAIEHRECQVDFTIELIGAADMNRALKLMLDQVADQVTALIYAPAELASHFDGYGCIDPDVWKDAQIDLDDDWILVADGPSEQADAVVKSLVELGGEFRADDITIGVPDASVAPQIQRRLRQCGVSSRWVVGRRLPESAPYRLLQAVAEYLESGRFDDFAAFVRHPDVADWLDERCGAAGAGRDWLAELDQYHADHLPPRLGKQWLGDPERHAASRQVHALVEQLVQPLGAGRKKLGDWALDIVGLLLQVYDGRHFARHDSTDHETIAAVNAIHKCLAEHQQAPAELTPAINAAQAIRLLLDQLQSQEVSPLPDPAAVELLGWLELPLDTSQSLIIASFNEGRVPDSLNADLFLPNTLRRRLGVLDNSRRYARDAYALSALAASRKRLRLIVGRRTADGDPLIPSRLLFATDVRTMARRCERFFTGQLDPLTVSEDRSEPEGRRTTAIYVPRAKVQQPIESMSVTSFRSYIACPFRFYLSHVLRLRSADDQSDELDAPAFGVLIHDVLNRFGRDDIRHSDNADHIRSFLADALRRIVRGRYGASHLAPVYVQLEQINARLAAFARWQAEWNRQGWEIVHAETPAAADQVVLDVDGQSIALTGRIDRVDRHRQSGKCVVFDYKTSEKASAPDETHRRRGEWTDLQLPLYRRFADQMGMGDDVDVGYIVLPKDVSKLGERIAGWSPGELASADRKALEVARNVLAQKFWPPASPPPRIMTDFSVICQELAFEKQFEPAPGAA